MKRKTVYPIGGISNTLNDITELFELYVDEKDKIVINTSAQPNSIPHIGSVTTIMCAFALGQKLKEVFNKNVEIEFDELENSTGKIIEIDEKKYVYSLNNYILNNGKTKAEIYMSYYIDLFGKLTKYSGIRYRIRTYKQYQSEYYVREAIVNIMKDYDFFSKLLSPKDKILHIRTECPECGLANKTYDELTYVIKNDNIFFKAYCPIHGKYVVKVNKTNNAYFDMNTQLRDLTKGVLLNSCSESVMPIMLDGGDWSGVWTNRMHIKGLMRLGYDCFPLRIYAPLLLDWSGAKFSKSLHEKKGAYDYLISKGLDNYVNFLKHYKNQGLEKLWREVRGWIEEPKKFFRNYSIEYISDLLDKKDRE
jgi:hypothetical protein